MLIVCRGRAAVPVTIRKSPAVTADGNDKEIWGTLDSNPLATFWRTRMGEARTVTAVAVDAGLAFPAASRATTLQYQVPAGTRVSANPGVGDWPTKVAGPGTKSGADDR